MIIDLNANVDSCEFAKVSVQGKNIETVDMVEISFSKEALIGFAKNLVWMYEDIDKNRKLYVCTDPLGGIPAGNQVVGFYLTASSPTLIFDVNSLDYDDELRYGDRNAINLSSKIKKCIEILPPVDDSLMEEYELGFRNIVDISLYNKSYEDITRDFYEIRFQINYEGLKKLAIMMMKLADSYKEGKEYTLAQVDKDSKSSNLGIILISNSLPVKIKLCNLGCVYDFEPDFGW